MPRLEQKVALVTGAARGIGASMAEFLSDCPLRRFGRPEEVAAVAVMLASDEAAYMTGAELHIDGGILAGAAAAPEPAGSMPLRDPAGES